MTIRECIVCGRVIGCWETLKNMSSCKTCNSGCKLRNVRNLPHHKDSDISSGLCELCLFQALAWNKFLRLKSLIGGI